jgi:phosphoenolpyruvate carboxykinase (diphosphate)
MDSEALERSIGLSAKESSLTDTRTITYINLKLASLGCPTVSGGAGAEFHDLAESLLARHRETDRLLSKYLCPADRRIQNWLELYLDGSPKRVKLPGQTFVLDRHGIARALSLPADRDEFVSDIVSSYRTRNGVLHNPAKDRRTTKGVFHVAEGGLPIPADKLAVPVGTFALMLEQALQPPADLMRLPFTDAQDEKAECWVSLLLRPTVCPDVPGFIDRKSLEVRFFAPGNLVSNLDFVESIFGNAGDPYLPANDAGLDVDQWTGHTGCVILAPHLVNLTKKQLGLPPVAEATERQKIEGMCWSDPAEKYNGGSAFKLTARDANGVIVTLIADNYFGYCKKEVKTQISFAANLFGLCEEEHAGGAIAFPSYDLGEEFSGFLHVKPTGHTFSDVREKYADVIEFKDGGYGVDRKYRDIVYVPEDVLFDLHRQRLSWKDESGERSLKLLAGVTYIRPSGYKVQLEKPAGGRAWRLIGSVAEGLFCHKPCTVSGGGKSEISKSISDAIIQGPVFVANFIEDFDKVEELLSRDYSDRFLDDSRRGKDTREILSHERSLGSVIKLLTPSVREYTEEYNQWLADTPQYLKELVFVVKRFYRQEWGTLWRGHFSVDEINGEHGNELRLDNRKLVSSCLRVGFDADGSWRVFSLRKDFHPAAKIQMEDDISASVVVPAKQLKNLPDWVKEPSVKFIENCEYRLFQRPDEAINPGYDKQTESDFGGTGNFFSNYHPLTREEVHELTEDFDEFGRFTEPMRDAILEAKNADSRPDYLVCNAEPRRIDGAQTKNPRYLQTRPDLLNPRGVHLAQMATRMYRRLGMSEALHNPVGAVLPGRRNNPPDAKHNVRALSVYNPIHYMELPELFMEYICSITGKSPSTTGAGSEGALTKAPFNALPPIYDLNNALVSYLLTGEGAFLSAAGYVGPKCRMDHDVSLLMPEVWCRMYPEERDFKNLLADGCLERVTDFEHGGRTIPASRLGYRITYRFVRMYFARVFNYPQSVFTEEMLKPERQDVDVFVDAMDNITETHQRVAKLYLADGSIAQACPPLKALLHIMAEGQYEEKGLDHPEIRALFERGNMITSDWYADRLRAHQKVEVELWERHVDYLERFSGIPANAALVRQMDLSARLTKSKEELSRLARPEEDGARHGTIGVQPL